MTVRSQPAGPIESAAPRPPFNWLQWVGLVLIVAGLALDIVYFAGEFGWTPKHLHSSPVGLPLIGFVLMVSGRRGLAGWNGTGGQRRSRWLTALVLLLGVVGIALGFALAFATTKPYHFNEVVR